MAIQSKSKKKGEGSFGSKTIVLAISEKEYSRFLSEKSFAKEVLAQWIAKDSFHRKLFPRAIHEEGYILRLIISVGLVRRNLGNFSNLV